MKYPGFSLILEFGILPELLEILEFVIRTYNLRINAGNFQNQTLLALLRTVDGYYEFQYPTKPLLIRLSSPLDKF